MIRLILLGWLFLLYSETIIAQKHTVDSNILLLRQLESTYKTPCITAYKENAFKRKRIKTDERPIKHLNYIYHTELKTDEIIIFLKRSGYTITQQLIKPERVYDTLIFDKVDQGYLDAYITIVYKMTDQRLISKK
jgi:hypothetical protein